MIVDGEKRHYSAIRNISRLLSKLNRKTRNAYQATTYQKNRPQPIRKNKKVIGLMKDELGGKIMTEFVPLVAKMYAYRKIDREVEEKRCKGTKECVVSDGLTFDDYKARLFDGKTVYREQMLFENKKHVVYTVNKHKIALNRGNDKRVDKRVAHGDGITTLASGNVALLA